MTMPKGFLVIEPDISECVLLQDLFTDDYIMVFAHDANEALEVLAKTPFTVVLFNLGQANKKSLCELKILKTHMRDKPMIIAITTHNNLEIERAIAEIGVFYHLLKPYTTKDLSDLVCAAFLGWERRRS
jgi:DNA-binding NtrC family response regulator